jgi:hypothetical protein
MQTATRTLTTRRLGSTDLELTTVGAGSGLVEPSVFAANAATGGRS